ncbi:SDR family NAD(P)-dependent oxidoreductase [Bacillus inaquosorum]|uniref:SDR family NAD(P)-dependent oxidoreductase n=1 Tax=Bacillus inaquosorum TaxID=483913 RepID=UPI002281EEA7|nr:SDR family NAD(P)-dependent oxidoreductase [Bacillus inaquosorum]MCY9078407.1 SDR family NAD(P)-dependent oxidoreductase [Bacillus inaquosorum]
MRGKREQISEILELIETGNITADEGYARVKSIQDNGELATDNPPLYYKTEWIESNIPNTKNADLPGLVLIFPENDWQIKELSDSLVDCNLLFVCRGEKFSINNRNVLTINPAKKADYIKLFKYIQDQFMLPENILHLWSDSQDNISQEGIEKQLESGIFSLLYITQALIEMKCKNTVKLKHIFQTEHKAQLPLHHALGAFVKTVHQEYPNFHYQIINVNHAQDMGVDNYSEIADIYRKECEGDQTSQFEVRYENGSRFTKRYKSANIDGLSQPLKRKGCYLITGGLGGLGYIIAKYLTEKWKANLILTGRSSLTAEQSRKINDLRSSGSHIEYIQSDISKKDETERVFTFVKDQFGHLNGVFHIAGVLRDSFILRKTKEEIDQVTAAKVYGTVWLANEIKKLNLDLFVLFSSTSSIFGSIGQGDYAFANAFLDQYAAVISAKGYARKTVSVNWPLWAAGGMNIDYEGIQLMRRELGLEPLDESTGLRALEDSLCQTSEQLIAVKGQKEKIENALNRADTINSLLEQRDEKNERNDELKQEIIHYLKKLLSEELKLSASFIDEKQYLEKYGIDSIMIMRLTKKLEQNIGKLSKTLFFEYHSITELADYFLNHHSERMLKLLNPIAAKPQHELRQKRITSVKTDAPNSIKENVQKKVPRRSISADIAIIGVSGRYPGAESIRDFQNVLLNGRDCISKIPDDRKEMLEGSCYNWGGFLKNVDRFDPLFFRISPKEAAYLDPQERLFLETVWNTIEDAGYTKSDLAQKKVGVFAGVTYGSYQFFGVEESMNGNELAVGSPFSAIANRVSYYFNFTGPSMAVDTMCSSSLNAIHLACESILRGESSIAVAGGVNLTLHPNKYTLLKQSRFFASDGRCRTFGAGGDGYVPGEGVGSVLLKPVADAINDGDHIYAVIKATAVNHGGKTNGFTVPNPNAQSELIGAALKKADIDPRTISYIEAHGTGTSLGDPIEITGLTKAFRQYTDQTQYCSIGSVKSNIGHLEAAAGIAGLTKVLIQMKLKKLFPSIHAETLNPNIDFEASPFYVQRSLQDWEKPNLKESGKEVSVPRRAGISSFGAGGTNVHVILEEYEEANKSAEQFEKEPHVVLLSAKNNERLLEYADKMKEYIKNSLKPTMRSGQPDMVEKVNEILKPFVSKLIHVNPKEIDPIENLAEFGFGPVELSSITGFINETFQIELSMHHLTDFRSIQSITEYLLKEYTGQVSRLFPKEGYGEEQTDEIVLRDLAYTTQVGREAMESRLAIVGSTLKEIQDKLNDVCLEVQRIPGVYLNQHALQQVEQMKALIEGKAGEQFVKSVIEYGEMEKLAQLWAWGADIDWKIVQKYSQQTGKRISIPTYPFAKESYWVPGLIEKNSEVKASAPKIHLQKKWREFNIAKNSEKPVLGLTIALVHHDTELIARSVCSEIEEKNLIIIRHNSSFIRQSDYLYECSFLDEKQAYTAVNEILMSRKQQIENLFDFSDISNLNDSQNLIPYGKIVIIQELIKRSKKESPLSVLQLTNGLQIFKTEKPRMRGAELAGLLKAVSSEYTYVNGKTIDTDSVQNPYELKQMIENEQENHAGEVEVCYRHGIRYIPFFEEDRVQPSESFSFRLDKTIVITGGTGGIGREIIDELVKRGVTKLVLTGTRPLPLRSEWAGLLEDASIDQKIIDNIKLFMNLEERGISYQYYSGSLTDKEKLRSFFLEARKDLGDICGVIHCAGQHSNGNPAFIHKGIEDFKTVYGPKIVGLQNLHQIFEDDPLDFFILFSSIAAQVPQLSKGMSDYASANAYMDYFAAYHFQMGKSYFTSINWPSWKEVGMGRVTSPSYNDLGLGSLSTQEGMATLRNALSKKTAAMMPIVKNSAVFKADTLLKVYKSDLSAVSSSKAEVSDISNNRTDALVGELSGIFAEELSIPVEKLDPFVAFQEYGVDSILLVSIIHRIEAIIQKNLDPTILFEHNTIHKLAEYVKGTGFQLKEQTAQLDSFSVHNVFEKVPESRKHMEKHEKLQTSSAKIAVIGIGCKFPGAANKEEFWRNLKKGRKHIKEVPESRWSIEKYYSPVKKKGKSISKWGGFIDGIGSFDPVFFRMHEETAVQTDPLIRHFLETSVQAVRDAGYEETELSGKKIGVFVGSRMGGYGHKLREENTHNIVGLSQNFIAAHVSHFFNFHGPSIVSDTACSSSLVSIHLACQSLIEGDSEMAIAGGADLLLDEVPYLMLSEGGALSPDGQCFTFDERANGFVPGEGFGAVLLKPLEKAKSDGDQIYGIIDASAINNDGATMGITTPNPKLQEQVIQDAFEKAKIEPDSVSYIETHGTGTMIGDPIELQALTKVFQKNTRRTQYCGVGSVKTNVGHLLSAAGAASFIKVILSLWHKKIPPTLNCETPNPRFEFGQSPFYPNTRLKEWKEEKRRAGISAFGFGGTNAHILVSGYDELHNIVRKPLTPAVFNKREFWPKAYSHKQKKHYKKQFLEIIDETE